MNDGRRTAGKPIFSEKPLADTVAKAEQAAAAVAAAGVPFQIGFQRRYDRGYARARELIAAGAIGEWSYYLLGSAVEVALLALIFHYARTWPRATET